MMAMTSPGVGPSRGLVSPNRVVTVLMDDFDGRFPKLKCQQKSSCAVLLQQRNLFMNGFREKLINSTDRLLHAACTSKARTVGLISKVIQTTKPC